MIRIETSRQTVVTFKTEKGALNRVARDAEWFANAAEAGTTGVVEVSARYDADARPAVGLPGRTVYDVDYVVYTELAPEDVPEGAQGQVSGTRRSHLGKAVPYGYSARVVGLHECGRLRLLNHTGTLVQREDEVLTLLPGSLDVVEDAVTAEDIVEGEYLSTPDNSGLGECPACGGTTYHDGERRSCQDCSWASWQPLSAGNQAAAPRSSYAPDPAPEWFHVVLGGSAGDSTVQVQGWIQALDVVRAALEPDLDGTVDVKVLRDSDGSVAYDVAEHDTCGVHPDATFSKDGPCPVCVEEDDAARVDTYTLQHRTVTVLRALHHRDTCGLVTTAGLTHEERQALRDAIAVLGL